MQTHFSLSEISKSVKIPVRKLRYVLDHNLLPDRTWFIDVDEPGSPRKLDKTSSCFLVSAVLLLESGIKREYVREFFSFLDEIQPKGRNPLGLPLIAETFLTEKDVLVLSADNTHVRCIVGKADSGWLKISSKFAKDSSYSPFVTVTLNLGKIRDLFK